LVIFFLLIAIGGGAFAEEKIVTGKFVVSFTAKANQKAWIVSALEQNIYNDLSGYGRIVPVNKVTDEDKTCKHRSTQCILEIYKNLNVDALMLGTVDNSDIDYQIYDVQNKYLISTGSIGIGSGSNLLKLRMGAFSAFKPFIEKGGILDKRKYSAADHSEDYDTNSQLSNQSLSKKLIDRIFVFLAIFTCVPYLLSFTGKPLNHPERTKIVLRWFYPFLIVSLTTIGYLYFLSSTSGDNIYHSILYLFGEQQWIITGFGGIAWGYFFIINYKIVMPHLQGIERIKPNNLFPLLQSCLLTLIIKALIFTSLYIVFFYGMYQFGLLFSVSQEAIVLLLFPLSGLYIICWVALVLDVFSMSIDVKLSGGKADYNGVWNVAVRKYFISHLKRNGASLNKRLVNSIVFLPGEHKGVVCYGGGFSRPRIAINKDLIKFTLGTVDEFNPVETGVFSLKVFEPVLRKNSIFQIYPNLSPQKTKKNLFKTRQDIKRAKFLKSIQKHFQSELKPKGNSQTDRIDNVTQGLVLPKFEGVDDFPSLMSDNLDDMQVVEELLLENSIDYDPYDEDAEIDDSSEHDKDFLFGELLQKCGALLRHEDIFSTIYLYFQRKKQAKRRPYNFWYSKYFAVVADTYVVLNFGLNHLLQHLYYQATNVTSYLTTKGGSSGMLLSQDRILTNTKILMENEKPKSMQTDEFDRIVWLSRFCQEPIDKQKQPKTRASQLIRWSIVLGVIYLMSSIVIDAYNYHPRYLEILEKEKHEIAQAIKDQQEKDQQEKERKEQ
jgi:hypothetical protein